MRRSIRTLIAIPLALAGALTAGSAYATQVCDFITGGGWVFDPPPPQVGEKVNFGVHGGCKNGAFWGHVNVVHHGSNPPARLRSTQITGYQRVDEKTRDICGVGELVGPEAPPSTVEFRVRVQDNGEPGGLDTFGLQLNGTVVIFPRELGPPGETGGGGNIKLHKEGKSTAPTPNFCPPIVP